MDDRRLCSPHLKGNNNSPIKFVNCAIFSENKTGKSFSTFHHQEILRRNSICSVTAWPFLRSKNCLSFFSRKHFQKVLKPSVILFACFLTENIICICHYFRWMSWPFLRARASRLVHSTLSSFFAWCRAKVCRSSSKDICTLQRVKQHGFLVISFFFICIFILFLALSYMYVFFNSLSAFPQIWK